MTLLSTEAVDEQATDDTPSAGGTAAVHDMTANDISKLKSMFAAKTDTMGPVGDVGSVNPAFDDTENTVSPHEGELHNDEAPVIDIAENSNLIISSNANNNVTSITDIPLSPMKTSTGADDDEDGYKDGDMDEEEDDGDYEDESGRMRQLRSVSIQS